MSWGFFAASIHFVLKLLRTRSGPYRIEALRDDPAEMDPAPSRVLREGVAGASIPVPFTSAWEPTDKMWETRSVNLNIRLPRDVARKAEAVQESNPEFLSHVLR